MYVLHGSVLAVGAVQRVGEPLFAEGGAETLGRLFLGLLHVGRTNQLAPLLDHARACKATGKGGFTLRNFRDLRKGASRYSC